MIVAFTVFAARWGVLALSAPLTEPLKLSPFVLLAVIGVATGAFSARIAGLADSMLEARFAQTKSALDGLRRQYPDYAVARLVCLSGLQREMAGSQTRCDEGLIAEDVYRDLSNRVVDDRGGVVVRE